MNTLQVRRLGCLDYESAVRVQEHWVRLRRAGACLDQLLALEHDPVITVGRSERASLPPTCRTPDGKVLPVVETSRGGQATYHGPGQLVLYPILDLRQRQRDLHLYLRDLERVIIDTLFALGVNGRNVEGYTGVWVGESKIASIGVAVRGWITYHGVALNVDCDMAGFAAISPCGLPADVMTSLARLGLSVTVEDVLPLAAEAFARHFGFLAEMT